MGCDERIHAVIPCRNEARHIGAVVEGVRARLPNVWVVDDGSDDETSKCATAAGATVIRTGVPRGKGAALKEGWMAAEGKGAEWVLCLDGDGQHSDEDIPAFVEAARRGRAGLVVGNRLGAVGDMPWVRRWTNRLMSRMIGALAGRRIPDSQCGFRMVRIPDWRELGLSTCRFEMESEMIVAAARMGWELEFVPVQSIYRDESSKISPWGDSWRWIRWYLRSARSGGGRSGFSGRSGSISLSGAGVSRR